MGILNAKSYIDKEAEFIKRKFLVVGQDIVAKFDEGVVISPNHILHLRRKCFKKDISNNKYG